MYHSKPHYGPAPTCIPTGGKPCNNNRLTHFKSHRPDQPGFPLARARAQEPRGGSFAVAFLLLLDLRDLRDLIVISSCNIREIHKSGYKSGPTSWFIYPTFRPTGRRHPPGLVKQRPLASRFLKKRRPPRERAVEHALPVSQQRGYGYPTPSPQGPPPILLVGGPWGTLAQAVGLSIREPAHIYPWAFQQSANTNPRADRCADR